MLLSDLLLAVVVLLQRLLQLGGDLLEEVDLLTEVLLHLGAEVPDPRAVEMLDLCQRGAGNDVAAIVELALLLWTVLHLGESAWRTGDSRGNKHEPSLIGQTSRQVVCAVQLWADRLDFMSSSEQKGGTCCPALGRQVGHCSVQL